MKKGTHTPGTNWHVFMEFVKECHTSAIVMKDILSISVYSSHKEAFSSLDPCRNSSLQ